MSTKQLPIDFPEIQGAIYRVALSLDAFLVNGIQYGVLQRVTSNGFLQETAKSLLSDLTSLEEQTPHAPVLSQPNLAELLASLRAKCQQLVDLVSGLSSFRTLALEQVRSTVSQIPLLRGDGVGLIQELEGYLQTPKPFYQSRPSHATAAVNDFFTDLECLFVEEWNASR
jgi:hypothetical protein